MQPGQSGAANAGFSLVEIAISLAVVGFVLGAVLVPLQTVVESRKIEETKRLLGDARELLLGYIAANGYLPCPADSTTNGQEALGGSGHDSLTGGCASSVGTNAGYFGYLPAATLGYWPVDTLGYGLDAWGTTANRIRYAVYTDTTPIGVALVRSGGMANAGIATLTSTPLINVCLSATGVTSTACGTSSGQVTLTSNAVAVIWSVGGDTTPRSAHETQNLANARVFVDRTRSDAAGTQFDDLVTWLPVWSVVSRLVAAGQMP